jgi:hypothetical protein
LGAGVAGKAVTVSTQIYLFAYNEVRRFVLRASRAQHNSAVSA